MTGRILIADGLATNRITLKVRLATACYEVLTATTADQVFLAARDRLVDLIILGSTVPDQDPLALCKRLNANPATSGIPVLMLCHDGMRLASLKAGAAAALCARLGEQILLARIRGLLRQTKETLPANGMAEAPVTFQPPIRADITLVADSPGRTLGWKHALSQRLDYRFAVNDAEQALMAATSGKASDLYLIAANLEQPGEGLRLLAELRSRPQSRDAAFIVAVPEGRDDIATVALDLGAGDTLPLSLAQQAEIDLAACTIRQQIDWKHRADRSRAETERNMMWAMTDPLTGLHNRRYALPRLNEIARNSLNDDQGFAVLAMDLDRFKAVNDRLGHAAGDAVLAEVAQRIAEAVGNNGMTARFGGEEFLVILPQIGESAATDIAEAIRLAVMSRPVTLPQRIGGNHVQVTLSIGLSTSDQVPYEQNAVSLAENMLDRADRAMMAAKSLGRNRVMRAPAIQAA